MLTENGKQVEAAKNTTYIYASNTNDITVERRTLMIQHIVQAIILLEGKFKIV